MGSSEELLNQFLDESASFFQADLFSILYFQLFEYFLQVACFQNMLYVFGTCLGIILVACGGISQ